MESGHLDKTIPRKHRILAPLDTHPLCHARFQEQRYPRVSVGPMTITVRDLTKLDTLLEALVKAGGNRIDSIGYETSDLRKYRDQARDMAVKAAHEKAGALAKALGQDIGKAQSIEEVSESGYQSPRQIQNALFANARSENVLMEAPSIAVGQKSISASVMVSFDLN